MSVSSDFAPAIIWVWGVILVSAVIIPVVFCTGCTMISVGSVSRFGVAGDQRQSVHGCCIVYYFLMYYGSILHYRYAFKWPVIGFQVLLLDLLFS